MSSLEPDDGAHHGQDDAAAREQTPEHGGKPGDDAKPDDDAAKPEQKQQEPPPPPPSRRLAFYVGVPLALLIAWGVFVHVRQSGNASDTLKQAQNAVPPSPVR